jgi:hypothetical protein
VTVDEDEPELMITAATHGDEIITPEVVLDLINKMVDGYNGGNQRFLDMVNNREIYFIISELLSKGIDKDDIYRKVFNTYSEGRRR